MDRHDLEASGAAVGRVWVLDLGAERELEALRAGGSPGPTSEAVRVAQRRAVDLLRRPAAEGGLFERGDVALDERRGERGPRTRHTVGAAWCPTPAAVEALLAADLRPEIEVDPRILVAANARETFAEVDPLPGALVVRDAVELCEALRRPPPRRAPGSGRAPAWLLRRSLCAAGRGRLVDSGPRSEAERWGERALAAGPVHVQPLVDVASEYAMHGRVVSRAEVRLGRLVRQTTRGGAYAGAEVVRHDVPLDHGAGRLAEVAPDVGRRLAELGYVGPFGVDGFAWIDGEGRDRFHCATDVNARYTMSFGVGAPDLLRAQPVDDE